MSKSLNDKIRDAYAAQGSTLYRGRILSDEDLVPSSPHRSLWDALYTVAERLERQLAGLPETATVSAVQEVQGLQHTYPLVTPKRLASWLWCLAHLLESEYSKRKALSELIVEESAPCCALMETAEQIRAEGNRLWESA